MKVFSKETDDYLIVLHIEEPSKVSPNSPTNKIEPIIGGIRIVASDQLENDGTNAFELAKNLAFEMKNKNELIMTKGFGFIHQQYTGAKMVVELKTSNPARMNIDRWDLNAIPDIVEVIENANISINEDGYMYIPSVDVGTTSKFINSLNENSMVGGIAPFDVSKCTAEAAFEFIRQNILMNEFSTILILGHGKVGKEMRDIFRNYFFEDKKVRIITYDPNENFVPDSVYDISDREINDPLVSSKEGLYRQLNKVSENNGKILIVPCAFGDVIETLKDVGFEPDDYEEIFIAGPANNQFSVHTIHKLNKDRMDREEKRKSNLYAWDSFVMNWGGLLRVYMDWRYQLNDQARSSVMDIVMREHMFEQVMKTIIKNIMGSGTKYVYMAKKEYVFNDL